MKKYLLLVFILFIGLSSFALEVDDSIDDVIKKNYNTGDSSLPKLPKISPKSIESSTIFDTGNIPAKPQVTSNENILNKPDSAKNISAPKIPQKVNVKTAKISWGKKINVVFNTAVSDRFQKGSRVIFITQAPVEAKGITIPKGTQIYGTVVNSHQPQILGNGGLLSVKADYIVYNGTPSYCEGNIISVNHQNILFNNIKGKNGYVKGIKKTMKPAKTFYSKSLKVSKKLWNSPGFILAPITYLPGALFYAGDALISPFAATFHKGDRVYINKGTTATIKLTSPAYIEY